MEMFQVAALLVGLFLSGVGVKAAADKDSRILSMGMGLLFLTFILLEFDTRSFDAPLLVTWTNGLPRNVWLGALWIGLGWMILRHLRGVAEAGWGWFRSPPGKLMFIAACFWIAGWVMDKFKISNKADALMFEELMEVDATYFMLLAAVLSLARFRGEAKTRKSD